MDKSKAADRPAATAPDAGSWTTTTPVNKARQQINYGGTERSGERHDVRVFVGKAGEEELSLEELLELKRYDCKEIIRVIGTRFGSMDEICRRLGTDQEQGLNESNFEEFNRRRHKFGSNIIPTKPTQSFFLFLWEAAQDTTLIILTVAALLSFGLSFYHPHHSVDDLKFNITTTGGLNLEVDEVGETEADRSERKAGWIEAIGILLAVLIIILVTAFVNWSKDVQFRGLQDRLSCQHSAVVVRSGKRIEIPVEELVVGDICMLNYGDVVPADGLLLHENELKIDESSHTGESEEATKSLNTDPLLFSGTHVKEGSGKMLVTAVGMHSAKGIILSLMGVSFNDENNPEEKRSLLHKKLVRIALLITYAGTAIALLTFLILVTRFCVETFVVRHQPWDNSYIHQFVRFLIISITLLAVAVPEGLPLAVILALAYSVKKMMADNNLVRHLDACETMGSATTICCDKTGTLTANRMTVVQSYIAGSLYTRSDDIQSLPLEIRTDISTAIAVNTNYSSQLGLQSTSSYGIPCGSTTIGSKTECALLGFIECLGQDYRDIRRLYPDHQHIHTYPFRSDRKWMGTVVRLRSPESPSIDGATRRGLQTVGSGSNITVYRLLLKGAAEMILDRCQWMVGEKCKIQSIVTDESRRKDIIDVINTMTKQGLRVLCIAYKDFTSSETPLPHEQMMMPDMDWKEESSLIGGLVCLAIVGIEDPVRPEVEGAVYQCQKAGIVVRMITGDNLQTAKFVAYKAGIISPEDKDSFLCIDGPTFNRMIRSSPEGPVEQDLIDRVWPRLRVLARSSPQDKYNLVKGIMDSKVSEDQEVVAVTGDGTNDGPALKKAHVGFAMGISGTDVAKEASDIILVDDNFASIIKAVVWGRHVYDSITKFIQFQLTVNIVAVVMALIGACAVSDSPLKGAQMLWVNLLMDTLASLSLATERPSEEVLNRRPYGCSHALVSPRMLLNILGHALYELCVLLSLLFGGAYLLGVEDGRSEALRGLPSTHYTVVFNAFVMMILFNEICARKLDNSLNFFSGLERGPLFVVIWLTSFVAQIAIVHWGGSVFSTTRLSLSQWAWCLLFGVGDLVYGFLLSLLVRICLRIRQFGRRRSSKEWFNKVTFDKSATPYELLTIDSVKSR